MPTIALAQIHQKDSINPAKFAAKRLFRLKPRFLCQIYIRERSFSEKQFSALIHVL